MKPLTSSKQLTWSIAACSAAVLTGVVTPVLIMLVLSGESSPVALASGPIFTLGLMGIGIIVAATSGRFWAGVLLALLNAGCLIVLALTLDMPALLHPSSTALAMVIASGSFAARGALFSKTMAARGWFMALFVVAGEGSVLLIATVFPGVLPDWFLALLPAQWANIAIQTAFTGSGTMAALPALIALAGTAMTTLLAARLWFRRWPYLLMFSAWLGLSALVYVSFSPMTAGGDVGPSSSGVVVAPDVEAFLQQMVSEEHFSGVALAVRAGEVLHANAYGRATDDQVNDLSTQFHVASVTKQFTAAATLTLVDRGTIELSDSINDHLPESYRSEKWTDVSVHHLLSHSSGIPDYAVERDYYDVVDGFCLGDTVDGMLREARKSELRISPGTAYEYSNIGFTLLGEIIEYRSGLPYEAYVTENLLAPLGMQSSRLHVIGHEPTAEEASGFRWNEDLQRHTKDLVVTLPVTAPDGGLVTSLDDFYRWTRIYIDQHDKILSDASFQKMLTPVVATGEVYGRGKTTSYGYGLYLGDGLISHEGYIVGFRSHFILDREDDELVVVFTNNTTNDPARISAGILAIIESQNEVVPGAGIEPARLQ